MRYAYLVLAFLIANSMSVFAGDKEGHKIEVTIKGLKDTICHLAGYYGPKLYYKDTVRVDSKGSFVFEGKEALPGGIYAVIIPGEKYFEFIIEEQFFSIETTKAKLVEDLKFKNSNENEVFYGYIKYLNEQQSKVQPYRQKMNVIRKMRDSLDDKTYQEDSMKLLRETVTKFDVEVKDFQDKYLEDNKLTLAAKVFKASMDVEIPEIPILANGRKDSTFAYRFLRQHYFDNIDLTDDRMIRTPIFHKKMRHFIKKLIPQHPDSIINASHFFIEKTRSSEEVFKYVLHYITNTHERSKYMGMDAVFVDMVEKYYETGLATWVDSVQMYKIITRAKDLKPTLIGKVAPNLILKDTSGRFVSLHHVPFKYTVLVFWDPDCGHCKKSIPKLKKVYDKHKELNYPVEIYSVCTE
ncbi:MAG: DUF5106 domain-containing protein, partial [Bacteroidia bacterium]|nr:DUF5106 domain-containing protein [Bacteroidia bacterium]